MPTLSLVHRIEHSEEIVMKSVFASLAAVLCSTALLATPALAADKMSQQDKMKKCNADAAGKKGDDRKSFMSTCLSAKADAPMTQQDKMKKCNVDAAGKKGDERKAFMSTCLKG